MPDPKKLQLTPTMLIGLGGTGKEVLLRVRKLFYERQGLNKNNTIGYPVIGYLLVDTDTDVRKIDGEPISDFVADRISLKDQTEFIHAQVEESDFHKYFKSPNLYPHIGKWLLTDMDKHGHIAIVKGAGQNRPFGRMGFCHNYAKIRQALADRIGEIVRKATDPKLVQAWKPDNVILQPDHLEVMLVYSLAGGTGGGMFLDMGMMVRDLISKMNLNGITCHYTHVALLPEVFINNDGQPGSKTPIDNPLLKKKIQENAFAALREIEYFSMKRDVEFGLSIPPKIPTGKRATSKPMYVAQWEPNVDVPIAGPPWDTFYLLGSSNDAMGIGHLSHRDVYQLIADYIFLDFDPSDFGSRKRSSRSNNTALILDPLINEVKDTTHPTEAPVLYRRSLSRRFSSFGLSQIYFDRARMRRAAGYRLARRLILEHWLRKDETAETTRVEMALHDLKGGVSGIPYAVTPLPARDDPATSLDWEPVQKRITRLDGADSRSWNDLLVEDVLALRNEFTGPQGRSATKRPILDVQTKHEMQSSTPPADAGSFGLAVRGFEDQSRRLCQDLKLRLRGLCEHRLNTHGIRATLALMGEYRDSLKTLSDAYNREVTAALRTAARRCGANLKKGEIVDVATIGRAFNESWQPRLAEAQNLPARASFAGRATQAEALRAVAGLEEYLKARYLNAAAPSLKAPLDLAVASFSDGAVDDAAGVSYARLTRRLQDALEGGDGVAAYLKRRFEEWSAQSGTPGRKIGLFAELKDDGYDALILQTPGMKRINEQARRGSGINWKGVEQAVLEHLARSKGEAWQDATTLGGLALKLWDKDGAALEESSILHKLGDELAEACEAVLDGFVANTTALDEFRKKLDDQAQWLEFFRKYSLPYVQFAGGVDAAPAQAPATLLLGISDGGNQAAREEFVETVTAPRGYTENGVSLSAPDVLSMKDDALVLLQEKAGLPLCYYKGLEELGRIYEKSIRTKEAHYDYRNLNHLLPEIRLANHDKQVSLAEGIRNTILGIMTRRVLYDRDRERYILSRGQGAGTIRTPIGSRFADVAEHLSQADNAEDQARLRASINAWIDDASKDDGGPLVALWCALQWMTEEIRQRVEYLAEETSDRPREDHSLLLLLNNKLEPEIRGRLQNIPRARAYLDSDLHWGRVFDDPEKQKHIPELIGMWRQQVSSYFESFVEEVIPVLHKEARPEPVVNPLASRSGLQSPANGDGLEIKTVHSQSADDDDDF